MRNLKAVSIGDLHFPFQDNKAIKLSMDFLKWYKPDYIFTHELLDGYSISSFDKSPDRIGGLQEELDLAIVYLTELRRLNPNAKIFLLNSNHQDRFETYKKRIAKAFYTVRNLRIDFLLDLKKNNVKMAAEYILNNVLFIHGVSAGTNPSNTAFKKNMMSLVQGHAHRSGSNSFTTRKGFQFAMNIGCLCDIEAVAKEYIKGPCQWTNGFGVVEWNNNRTYPTNIVFDNYSFKFGNKLFEINDKLSPV